MLVMDYKTASAAVIQKTAQTTLLEFLVKYGAGFMGTGGDSA